MCRPLTFHGENLLWTVLGAAQYGRRIFVVRIGASVSRFAIAIWCCRRVVVFGLGSATVWLPQTWTTVALSGSTLLFELGQKGFHLLKFGCRDDILFSRRQERFD